MLTIQHRDNPPSNGRGYYVYVDPDSGMRFEHPYFDQLRTMAKAHRKVNQYPIGSNWNQELEENVCANTPGELCFDVPEITATDKAANFARAMMNWALSGFKTVSEEVANERQTICKSCEHYIGNKGFFQMACGACGCSAKKIFLATESCPLPTPKWVKTI